MPIPLERSQLLIQRRGCSLREEEEEEEEEEAWAYIVISFFPRLLCWIMSHLRYHMMEFVVLEIAEQQMCVGICTVLDVYDALKPRARETQQSMKYMWNKCTKGRLAS